MSQFLQLPLEIRLLVYAHLFVDAQFDLVPEVEEWSGLGYMAEVQSMENEGRKIEKQMHILLTCRQIYRECRNITFSSLVFHIAFVPPSVYWLESSQSTMPLLVPIGRKLDFAKGIMPMVRRISITFGAVFNFCATLSHWRIDEGVDAMPNVLDVAVIQPSGILRDDWAPVIDLMRVLPCLQRILFVNTSK